MNRRRSTPWIHLRSRLLLGAIAVLGAILTAYLTITKLTGGSAACPTEGCNQVLSSPYASIFGLPLTLFGCLAYIAMAVFALAPLAVDPAQNKGLRAKLENQTWLLLFAGSTAMVIFSGYLMYVLAFKIQASCLYCFASAAFSASLFILTLIGRAWEDIGQLFFTGIVVGMVALVGTLGVYSNVSSSGGGDKVDLPTPTSDANAKISPPATTTSGPAEIALAKHLQQSGVKEYGAYWCPHCYDQKQLFGREAEEYITYIECADDAINSQAALCRAAGIKGYPTWEINGQLYSGIRQLTELAQLSGYQGPQNFQNVPPARNSNNQ